MGDNPPTLPAVAPPMEEYECIRNILLPKGMCSESHDLFKFWELSDNVSETVQDRDIVAMEY